MLICWWWQARIRAVKPWKAHIRIRGEDSHVWTSTLVLCLLKHEDSGHPAAAAPELYATQYVSYWSLLSIDFVVVHEWKSLEVWPSSRIDIWCLYSNWRNSIVWVVNNNITHNALDTVECTTDTHYFFQSTSSLKTLLNLHMFDVGSLLALRLCLGQDSVRCFPCCCPVPCVALCNVQWTGE